MKKNKLRLAGIEISSQNKIIFPEKKITKGQMAQYYYRIADHMLPYMKNRPLTLQRFPGGIRGKGFYQKKVSDYFPDFIPTVDIETEEGINKQIICNSKKTLLYLVNQNTVIFHIWLSRKDKLRQPDRIVFDLDPPKNAFSQVKQAAVILREFLIRRGKSPSLMTTGKGGLHLFYYQRRGKDFDSIKAEVRALAEEIEQEFPDIFTTSIRKNKREGKIFLDYLRNEYAQTAVCPYSLRATEDAGIATPIHWEELEQLNSSGDFHIGNIFDNIKTRPKPKK